jgi:hypothetical protein
MGAIRSRKETYAMSTNVTGTFATLVSTMRAGTATDYGIDCTMARGVNAVASMIASKTITSGTLKAFCYMPVDVAADGSITTRRWVRCPSLDLTLVGGDVERDEPSGDMETPAGCYRFAFVPDAVTGSSGSTSLTLTYSVVRSAL